jgi:hypothetical protein
MSHRALILTLFAGAALTARSAAGSTASDHRPPPARPGPVSTAAAERAARGYLRRLFPEFASRPLVVESRVERPATHPLGEEVSLSFHEVLPGNGARTGNLVAVRVKRGRQVFLERERLRPVPAAASAPPAISPSRAKATAAGAVGPAGTHVAAAARLFWTDRLLWRVPVAPRAGGHPTAEVAVDAQSGAVLQVSRYR